MSEAGVLRARRSLADPRLAPWLALVSGAVAGLGQVPFSLVPLALLALLCGLFLLHGAGGTRRAAWLGWLAGTGYFAVTLHWIVDPFLVDPERHGWMAPFALLFCATGFALFWGLAWGLAHRIAPRGWRLSAAWAVCLSGAELLRAKILTGFPWAMPAYIWADTPARPLVAWTGAFGLTFLTLALLACAHALLRARPASRLAALGAPALALLLPWMAPQGLGLLLTPAVPAPGPDAPVIRLVQPNAPQDEKWDADRALMFLDRQLDFTAAPGAPDLTVWPETAIPYLVSAGHPVLERISAAAQDRPVLVGAQRADGARYYNSLFALGPGGTITARYDKHHLVPFGEYVPLGDLGARIGLPNFAAERGYGFSAGPGPQLLHLGRAGTVLPLICYEAIFPRDVAGAPGRADWIVQVTNDAWFGTFAGPQQHLAQAQFRAAEQGLPLLRAANTGISGVIGPTGALGPVLPLGQAGYLDVVLPPPLPPTLYARTGDLPLVLGLILLATGLFLARRRGSD